MYKKTTVHNGVNNIHNIVSLKCNMIFETWEREINIHRLNIKKVT